MSDRDEFEKWAKDSGYAILKTGLNQYFYGDTGAAWDAWQAARAKPCASQNAGSDGQGEAEPFGTESAYLTAKELGFGDNMKISAQLVVELIDALRRPAPSVPDRDKLLWSVYDHAAERFDFNKDPVLDILGYLVDAGVVTAPPEQESE